MKSTSYQQYNFTLIVSWRPKHTLNDIGILFLVNQGHSRGWGGTNHAAYVTRTLFVVINIPCRGHQARCDVGVRAHIFWFLLRPDNLGIVILGAVFCNLIECEWGDLLQTNNGNIGPFQL